MQKINKKVPVLVEELQEKEIYITSDGRVFQDENEAYIYENLFLLKKVDVSYFPSYNQPVKIVYFENEDQVELYEQFNSGNKDDNTWMSWKSNHHKHKFYDLPKWIVCSFENHQPHSEDYSAFYYTVEEFKQNLQSIISTIEELK